MAQSTTTGRIEHLELHNSSITSVGGNLNTYNVTYTYTTTNGSSSTIPSLPLIDCPFDLLSPNFTGREHELVHLKRIILGAIRNDVPIRCIVYGMHGIGKTQLILRFLALERQPFSMVFWISASTIEKVNQGYSGLLTLLNHPDRFHVDQAARLTAARLWLEKATSVRWVLVFDNVEPETVDFLREHLPRKNRRGRIIFTTRMESVATALANAGGQVHDSFELRAPNVGDASRLLFKYIDGDRGVEARVREAADVVRCVGCLPLAVAQAGSYMKKYGMSLQAMRHLYQSQQKMKVNCHLRSSMCMDR